MVVHRRVCPYAHTLPYNNYNYTGERLLIEKAVKGREDNRGALPEPRRCGDGTRKGPEDILLKFADDRLGCVARHGERTPGD
jgi:hypothetical protein